MAGHKLNVTAKYCILTYSHANIHMIYSLTYEIMGEIIFVWFEETLLFSCKLSCANKGMSWQKNFSVGILLIVNLWCSYLTKKLSLSLELLCFLHINFVFGSLYVIFNRLCIKLTGWGRKYHICAHGNCMIMQYTAYKLYDCCTIAYIN